MAKVKRQTYTLNMYLEKLRDSDIRSDADVQRLSGAWNNAMTNELIISVLNGEYIPPIILGQEKNSQAWIVDGLQRSTALMMFRFGSYKVTSSVEEPIISYRAKVRDAEGEVKIDGKAILFGKQGHLTSGGKVLVRCRKNSGRYLTNTRLRRSSTKIMPWSRFQDLCAALISIRV